MTMKRFGAPVPDWTPPRRPQLEPLEGRHASLVRLDADSHAEALHRANAADPAIWDYLPYGPFRTAEDYRDWIAGITGGDDPLFYAIQDRETGQFGGVASYLRITPEMGCIEVGHINLSPSLQRTRAATEAMVLMMDWAFTAGYRRYEWKCDALNLASRRAAERLGFSYEGVFRQAAVVKGRNRDTAWFAVTDGDWPALRDAYQAWLDPGNFDSAGCQRQRLGDLTGPVRVSSDPVLTGSGR